MENLKNQKDILKLSDLQKKFANNPFTQDKKKTKKNSKMQNTNSQNSKVGI